MTASVDLIARRRTDEKGVIREYIIYVTCDLSLKVSVPFSDTLSSLLSGALNFVGVGGLLGLNSNGKVTRPDEFITAKIVRHRFWMAMSCS